MPNYDLEMAESVIAAKQLEIERLNAEVDEYQQYQDEIIVALGSKGLLPSEIVKEIERLTALLNDPVRLRHYIEQQMDDEAARNAIQTAEQVENDG